MTTTQVVPSKKFVENTNAWKAGEGIQFASPDVQKAYQGRVQMFIDAITLKKPERIPIFVNAGTFAWSYGGCNGREAMYDYEKLGRAMKKYHTDFMPDSCTGSPLYGPGKAFEIMDYKLYRWPGHGVPDDSSYQYVEAEYMGVDEYDQLIQDPTDFFIRRYLPRVFGALKPWTQLGCFTDIQELPFTGPSLIPFGLPDVQESLRKLMQAGQAAVEWIQACAKIDGDTASTLGIPAFFGGFVKAPFDILGDTLRGTRQLFFDKFRRPKKVLEAIERLVPLAIDQALRAIRPGGAPIVLMPLHKGADEFMSAADFKTFYWPTLKAVILGLIANGVVPCLFVEGSYNQRLDIVTDPDIPAGTTAWIFDETDLREVKKRFTGWACFGGNVPSSLLMISERSEVEDHVKGLIDDVGQDGGYILGNGRVLDQAKVENLHAMIDTCKTHGVYR